MGLHAADLAKRDIGIERLQLTRDGRHNRPGLSRGSHHDVLEAEVRPGKLAEEIEDLRRRRERQSAVHEIPDYADDPDITSDRAEIVQRSGVNARRRSGVNLAPDGILIREILAHELFVDDRDRLARGRISRVEIAAADELEAHRAEVVLVDGGE